MALPVIYAAIGLFALLGAAGAAFKLRKAKMLQNIKHQSDPVLHSPSKNPILSMTKWVPNPWPHEGEWADFFPLGPVDQYAAPFEGLRTHGWTQDDILNAETVAKRLAIPINAMLAVLASESGLNPKKLLKQKIVNKNTGKVSYFYAAGLPQLTRGANQPGYTTNETIIAFADKPISEQLVLIERMWSAIGKKPNISPGRLYLYNFLPEIANKPVDFIIGEKDSKEKIGGLSKGAIWAQNPGFDPARKGRFTVGDVFGVLRRNTAEQLKTMLAHTKPSEMVGAAPQLEESLSKSPLLKILDRNDNIPWGDPRWTDILRKDKWTDAEKEKPLGTTCADFAGWILEQAGLAHCLAKNGRFRTGPKFFQCAAKADALVTKPKLENIEPGDLFELANPKVQGPWHVGFVRSRDGFNIVTIDGGQGPREAQAVKRQSRRLEQRADGLYVGNRRLEWVIKTRKLLGEGK